MVECNCRRCGKSFKRFPCNIKSDTGMYCSSKCYWGDPIERFWACVKKTDTCWLWIKCDNDGYGRFKVNGKTVKVHRFSYELHKGEIPKGLELDHLCRNRSCVNPDHLEAVTHKENILRSPIQISTINAIKTHCARGHELNETNAYLYYRLARGRKVERICRSCQKERAIKKDQ